MAPPFTKRDVMDWGCGFSSTALAQQAEAKTHATLQAEIEITGSEAKTPGPI